MTDEKRVAVLDHAKAIIESQAKTTMDLPVAQMTGREISQVVSSALAEGISRAVVQVLESPQLSNVLESVARGKAVSGILEALCVHSGRQGLDARTMNQNAIDMTHAVDIAFEHYKKKVTEWRNQRDPAANDEELDYLAAKAKKGSQE